MKHLHNSSTTVAFDIRTLSDLYENGIVRRSDLFQVVWETGGQGQILLIKPGQAAPMPLTGETTGYLISFNTAFLDGNFYQAFAHTRLSASGPEAEDMQDIMAIMRKEFSRNHLIRVPVLKRYLNILLICLSYQCEHTRQTRNEAMLSQFMNHLEKNFRAQKKVADYAGMLSVTPNYLNEVIKKITGHPAGYHIRQRVALEAKRQAAGSGAGMKSIAYDLGFCDIAHFSKFFKNATGMNFSDFKNSGRLYAL